MRRNRNADLTEGDRAALRAFGEFLRVSAVAGSPYVGRCLLCLAVMPHTAEAARACPR